jgi:osmotically-inducible protein OsmY
MSGMTEELWLSHAEEVQPQLDVQERIWDELQREPEADTADVSVWVEDFVATLRGSVASESVRMMVARTVQQVPGVREVVNELRVASANAGQLISR